MPSLSLSLPLRSYRGIYFFFPFRALSVLSKQLRVQSINYDSSHQRLSHIKPVSFLLNMLANFLLRTGLFSPVFEDQALLREIECIHSTMLGVIREISDRGSLFETRSRRRRWATRGLFTIRATFFFKY